MGTTIYHTIVASSWSGSRIYVANRGYVSCDDGCGYWNGSIYASYDLGSTWTALTGLGFRYWTDITTSADGTKIAAIAGVNGDEDGFNIITSSYPFTTSTMRTSAGTKEWKSVTSSADGTKLAAVVSGGYIYTSTNSGETWLQTNSEVKYWYSVASSADGTKLVAVTYGDYIYTSSNGGETWVPRAQEYGVKNWWRVTSSADGTKLAAVVYGGDIYTSTDSGVTWFPSYNFGMWRSIASSADGTKLAAGAIGGYLNTSADSGETWTTQSSLGVKSWYNVASSADGTKLIVSDFNDTQNGDSYIYTSVSSASSPVQLGHSPSYNSILITPTPTITFTTNKNAYCRASLTDESYADMANDIDCTGDNTTSQSCDIPDLGADGTKSVYIACSDGTYEDTQYSNEHLSYNLNTQTVIQSSHSPNQSLGISDSTPTITFTTNKNAYCRASLTDESYADMSDNTDCTGDNTTSQSCTPDLGADGTKSVYIACSDGIHEDTSESNTNLTYTLDTKGVWTQQSNIGTENWTRITSSANGTKLAAISLTPGFKYVYTSPDSGITWYERTNPGSKNWTSIKYSAYDDSIVATIGGTSGIGRNVGYFISDGGGWQARTNIGLKNWNSVTCSNDCEKVAAVVYNGLIYTSTDGGFNWESQTSAGSTSWQSIASSADGERLIAGSGVSLYIGVKSGGTWTWTERTPGGVSGSWRVTSSANGLKLAIANENYGGYIYTSIDGGETWTQRINSSSNWKSITSSSDGTKLAAVGSGGHIHTSRDGGATWTQQTDAGVRDWQDITSSADGNKLAAVVYGGYIYTYVYDDTSPVISETSAVSILTNDTTPDYAFTTDEAGTITYGGSCSSAVTSATVGVNTITFNELSQGSHSDCTVTVTDSVGNVSNLLPITPFTIDSILPTKSSFNPASGTTISDTTPTITFTTNENAYCKASLTDESYANMSDDITCTVENTTNQSCDITDLGVDGTKNIYIACKDGINEDTSENNENLTYTLSTNTAPNIPTLVSPSDASYTTDATPTLSANYSDPNTGDIGTTNYRIDSLSANDCISGSPTNVVASGTSSATSDENENTTWTPDSSIGSDGTYYWCAQNNDSVATSAWTSMGSFILDTNAPTTSDNYSEKDDVWQNENQTITLTANCDVSGCLWTKYCLTQDCDPANGTDYTGAVLIANEGTTYFRYASKDNAQNTQTTVSKIVKIDKTAPTTVADAGSYTFGQTSTGDVTVTLSCVDGSGSGCLSTLYCTDTSNSCTPTTAYTTPVLISTEGTSYIRYLSTDALSNTETAKSQTIKIAVPVLETPASGGGGYNPAYDTSRPTNIITRVREQLDSIIKQAQGLVGIEEQAQIVYPPIEESVTEEAPIALQGWNIMELKPINELALNPIESNVSFFSDKIPQFKETLAAFGTDINNISDVQKFSGVDLYLPGLTKIVLSPEEILAINKFESPDSLIGTEIDNNINNSNQGLNNLGELTLNQFASVQGVPLSKLSIDAQQRIPTDIVFVRSEGGLIDYSLAVSIDKTGGVVQKLNTTSGKTMDLVIKPEKPAKSVTGFISLKKFAVGKTNANVLGYMTKILTASIIDSIDKDSDKNEKEGALLMNKFEYLEVSPGIFKATVNSPQAEGEYEISTIIAFEDINIAPKETKMTAIVNPEGYVYRQMADGRLRIEGVNVELHWLNSQTSNYELWPANEFLQKNPVLTDDTGKYSFLVPEGTYKIIIKDYRYATFESDPFTMKGDIAINQNIELFKKNDWLGWFNWQVMITLLLTLLILYNFWQNEKIRNIVSKIFNKKVENK